MGEVINSLAGQGVGQGKSKILPLPLGLLKRFAAKMCRVRNRSDWWAGPDSHELSVMGKTVHAALKARNELCSSNGENLKPITKEEFIDALPGGSAGTMHNFLEGAVTTRPRVDYPTLAENGLNLLMLGNDDSAKSDTELQREAKWVSDFFFRHGNAQEADRDPNKRSFFDSRFQAVSGIARYIEAAAELRSLAVAQSAGAQCRVVRVSGRIGFPFFRKEDAELSQVGVATLRCLEAGVQVATVFCSLSGDCDAVTSAVSFEKHINALEKKTQDSNLKCLRTISLQPGRRAKGRWSGEYLNRVFRWTLYERLDGTPPVILVTRREQQGPAAISPDNEELRDFRSWCETFVWGNKSSKSSSTTR